MKTWVRILVLFLAVASLAACDESQPTEQPPDLSGPALIMFYTDN